MENIGTGTPLWLELLKFTVVLLFAFMAAGYGYRSYKAFTGKEPDREAGKKKLYLTAFMVILLITAITFFYFAFGSGKKVQLPPTKDQGIHKVVEGYPDEKSPAEIRKDAETKKPDVLKRQDEGFQKDAKEADDYVKKALEEAEKSKKKKK